MGLFPFEPQVSTCCSRAGAGFRGTRSPSRRPLAAPQRARSGRVTDVVGERAARFHSQRAPSSPGVGAPGKAGWRSPGWRPSPAPEKGHLGLSRSCPQAISLGGHRQAPRKHLRDDCVSTGRGRELRARGTPQVSVCVSRWGLGRGAAGQTDKLPRAPPPGGTSGGPSGSRGRQRRVLPFNTLGSVWRAFARGHSEYRKLPILYEKYD